MTGFDVNRFVAARGATWRRLEQLLLEAERHGLASMSVPSLRELGRLYRTVSSDLIRARTEMAGAAVIDYLNDVVARAYAVIHVRETARAPRRWLLFLTNGFPRTLRRERRAVGLSAALLLSGIALGALFVARDPQSLGALIPEDHQQHTPGQRIADEEARGGSLDGEQAIAFSGFLFTHNIQVTFLVFALGITFGVGTAALLFYNGIPLGALAMQYHLAGQDLFFWAWILPHGIPELTVVVIGGAAGLILARGQWMPGRLTRGQALAHEARTAVTLVLGGAPLLVLAGVIEGTLSQMHEPTVAYTTKLAVAGLVGVVVYGYLLRSGQNRSSTSSSPSPSSPSSSLPRSSS